MKASGEAGALHQDLNLRLLLVGVLAVFHRVLKILDTLAQAFAEIGNLTGTKNQHRDETNYQEFWKTKFTQHKRPPPVDSSR